MRKILMATVTCAMFVLPTLSYADDAAVPGAVTGAVTGAIVGGPVGAVVGAGVGATIGSGIPTSPRQDVIIEQRRGPVVEERTCVKDAWGNMVCDEIQR